MYITLKSIKRNLGFKGLELTDIIIALPIMIVFIVLFCFTRLQILSLIGLMIGVFCLLPTNFSKKNRMYKIIILMIKYLIKTKKYVYKKG